MNKNILHNEKFIPFQKQYTLNFVKRFIISSF